MIILNWLEWQRQGWWKWFQFSQVSISKASYTANICVHCLHFVKIIKPWRLLNACATEAAKSSIFLWLKYSRILTYCDVSGKFWWWEGFLMKLQPTLCIKSIILVQDLIKWGNLELRHPAAVLFSRFLANLSSIKMSSATV